MNHEQTEINRLVSAAFRSGELWERCQGKGWSDDASSEFTTLRDKTMPEIIAQLLEQITNLKEQVRILGQVVRYEPDLCQQSLDSRNEMENEVARYAKRVKRDQDYIFELRDTVEELERELEAMKKAAKDVLSHVEGDLPTKGWLRDNDRSRRAIWSLKHAIKEVK